MDLTLYNNNTLYVKIILIIKIIYSANILLANEYDFKKYMVVYRLSEKTINVIFEDDKGFL